MCAVMAGGCTHIKTFVFGARPTGHYCTDRMMKMQENIPLAPFTTLRAGGPARYFFVARTDADIAEAIGFARAHSVPFFVLGGGSNVLISDSGFPGVVIKNEIGGIAYEELDDGRVCATAGAGVVWDDLVKDAVERGLYGLENLSLIPGTVGAAPVQNIGAYGTEVEHSIDRVEAFDIETGEERVFSNAECGFAYRDSMFKRPDGKKYIVTRVSFLLHSFGTLNTVYKDVAEYFAQRKINAATLADMRNAIVDIRTRKLPDMRHIGTAGSFFENPIVSIVKKDDLLDRYPELVWYPFGESGIKISAAWLIDHIGEWKGKRDGNVGTYERHALVFVNYASENAREIYDFAERIRADVKNKTGIDLNMEVSLLGDFR